MQTSPKLLLLTAVSLLLPHMTLQAQQAPALGIGGTPGAQRGVLDGGAVPACSKAGPCDSQFGAGGKVTQTIALQIPDFKPEDLADHVYVLVAVGEKGSSADNPGPDQNGILYKQILERHVPAGTVVLEQDYQYFLAAINGDTQEARFTLDLHEVRLWPFLAALQLARRNGASQLSELWRRQGKPASPLTVQPFAPAPGQQHGPGPGVQGDQALMLADIRLSIQGEHLHLDAVLDHVFLETGCSVEPTVEAMLITACR